MLLKSRGMKLCAVEMLTGCFSGLRVLHHNFHSAQVRDAAIRCVGVFSIDHLLAQWIAHFLLSLLFNLSVPV